MDFSKKILKSTDLAEAQKLIEKANKLYEGHIMYLEVNEELKGIDKLGFGELITVFNNITPKLFESKEGRGNMIEFLDVVKKNPSLRKYYLLHENFASPPSIKGDPKPFITESLKLAESISQDQLKKGVNELSKVIAKGIKFAAKNGADIKSALKLSNDDKSFNESVDYLITNKKKLSNIVDYVNHFGNLTEHVSTARKDNTIDVLSTKIANVVSESKNDINSKDENTFNLYKTSCINLIDRLIEGNDTAGKERLSVMREQIDKKMFDKDKAIDDIINFIELENVLKGL